MSSRAVPVVFVCVLLVAACGGDDDTETNDGSADTEIDASGGDTVGGEGDADAETDGTGSDDAGMIDPDADPWADVLPETWEPSEEVFGCVTEGSPVDRYYLWNVFGLEDEALEVASGGGGEEFPPGTVIQLVPQEAMVKRLPGFNDATNDWEFFFLEVDAEGTTIQTRGVEDVENAFGGNCFGCHAPAQEFDFVCGSDHGCDPLPLTEDFIRQLQNGDPRCQ